MKFRDRLIKAEFWADSYFFRLSAAQRLFFVGLWNLAEDSGCLEDDPVIFKHQLFGSPADGEITPELIEEWKNRLIQDGKLIPYPVEGKNYLFIKHFHKYQQIKNPSAPNIPLPEWITFSPFPSNPKQGSYEVAETITTTRVRTGQLIISENPLTNVLQTSTKLNQINTNQIKLKEVPPKAANPADSETGFLFSQGEDDRGEEPALPPNQKTSKSTNKKGDSRIKEALDYYSEQYQQIHGSSPKLNYGREGAIIKDHLAHLDKETNHHGKSLEILKDLLTKFLNLDDGFLRGKGYSLNLFPGQFNGLRLSNRQANPQRKEVAKSGQSNELNYLN